MKIYQNVFVGTFDGKYHNIVNLKINGEFEEGEIEEKSHSVGFFTFNYGTIKNLTIIINTTLTLHNEKHFFNSGILVGVSGILNNPRRGIIENCEISGNMTINVSKYAFNLGGVCGALNGTMRNCSNNANILLNADLNSSRIGGVCGIVEAGSQMYNCYNKGNLTFNFINKGGAGGITGNVSSGSTLVNSYNIGKLIDNTKTSLGNVYLDECIGGKSGTSTIKNIFGRGNLLTTSNENSIISSNFTPKSESELKGTAGVTLLNTDNDDPVWVEDTNNINGGYPILNWQADNN